MACGMWRQSAGARGTHNGEISAWTCKRVAFCCAYPNSHCTAKHCRGFMLQSTGQRPFLCDRSSKSTSVCQMQLGASGDDSVVHELWKHAQRRNLCLDLRCAGLFSIASLQRTRQNCTAKVVQGNCPLGTRSQSPPPALDTEQMFHQLTQSTSKTSTLQRPTLECTTKDGCTGVPRGGLRWTRAQQARLIQSELT